MPTTDPKKTVDMNKILRVYSGSSNRPLAEKIANLLGCSLAIAHKGRPRHNAAEVMGIIGDIKGKTCIINDDMIAIPVEVGGKIKTISVAEEFAETIAAVYHEESVSRLIGGDFAL